MYLEMTLTEKDTVIIVNADGIPITLTVESVLDSQAALSVKAPESISVMPYKPSYQCQAAPTPRVTT